MKQIIKRCSNIGADVLGFIKVGSDSLALVDKTTEVRGILNGCEIFKTANVKDNVSSIVHVLGDITLNLYSKNKPEDFTVYRGHWASDKYAMGDILDQIVINIKKTAKVTVKTRTKEAAVNLESSIKFGNKIDPSILNRNVQVFSSKINNAGAVLKNLIKCSAIVTGYRFGSKDSVWGEKNIYKYMDCIKNKIAVNTQEIDKIDFYKEMIERTANKIHIKLSSELFKNNCEERKILGGVLIPELVSSYEGFKKLATSVIFAAAPLSTVDELFRKNTNYPVSWFVEREVLANLNDGYSFLINFLQELPRIETNAVIPLDVYGTQILK